MRYVLALPTPEIIQVLANLPGPIVEIGAGAGVWAYTLLAYDIPVFPVDINGDDKLVARCSHIGAPHGDTLLVVWPPDGPIVQDWITVQRWKCVVLVGNMNRIDTQSVFDEFYPPDSYYVPPGIKGPSECLVYRRAE